MHSCHSYHSCTPVLRQVERQEWRLHSLLPLALASCMSAGLAGVAGVNE